MRKEKNYIKKLLEHSSRRKEQNDRLPETITNKGNIYYKNGMINDFHIYTTEDDKQIAFTMTEMFLGVNHDFKNKKDLIKYTTTFEVKNKIKRQDVKKDCKIKESYEVNDLISYDIEKEEKDTNDYWSDNEIIRRGDNNLLMTKKGYEKYLLLKKKK